MDWFNSYLNISGGWHIVNAIRLEVRKEGAMRKKKHNLSERVFNSAFRCFVKVITLLCIIIALFVGIVGSELNYNFKMTRVEKVVKQSFFDKLLSKVDIFDLIKRVL